MGGHATRRSRPGRGPPVLVGSGSRLGQARRPDHSGHCSSQPSETVLMPGGVHYFEKGDLPQLKRKGQSAKNRRRVTQAKQKRDERLKSICGAKKRNGYGECRRMAGWGTKHPGIGRCKYHSGGSPMARKNSIKEEAIVFMGAPRDINPFDAIMWCIRITAGEVEWLSMKIAEVDEIDWIEE